MIRHTRLLLCGYGNYFSTLRGFLILRLLLLLLCKMKTISLWCAMQFRNLQNEAFASWHHRKAHTYHKATFFKCSTTDNNKMSYLLRALKELHMYLLQKLFLILTCSQVFTAARTQLNKCRSLSWIGTLKFVDWDTINIQESQEPKMNWFCKK